MSLEVRADLCLLEDFLLEIGPRLTPMSFLVWTLGIIRIAWFDQRYGGQLFFWKGMGLADAAGVHMEVTFVPSIREAKNGPCNSAQAHKG